MGERLLCKQEVIGSIPFTSTTAQCAEHALSRGRARHNAVVPKAARRREGLWASDAASPLGAAHALALQALAPPDAARAASGDRERQ